MKVSKWSNSEHVEVLRLREGDDVTLLVAGNPALEITKTPSATELLVRLRRFRGRLSKDFEFNRLEASERR